jgi:hypothetical protein
VNKLALCGFAAILVIKIGWQKTILLFPAPLSRTTKNKTKNWFGGLRPPNQFLVLFA